MTGSIQAGDFADAFESGTVEYRVKELDIGQTYRRHARVEIDPDEEIVDTEFITDGAKKTVRVWIRRRKSD